MDKYLIKEGLSSLRKERIIINKIMLANERDDDLSFMALQDIYKEVSQKTDSIVDNISKDFDLETLKNLLLRDNNDNEESLDKLTLLKLVNYKMLDKLRDSCSTIDSAVFNEEHSKYLYSTYMWYVKNNELSQSIRKSLHNLMLFKFVGSSTLRNFFAGNYDVLDSISNPKEKYDFIPDKLINKYYYLLFNDLIEDVETSELFTLFFKDKSLFESNKKFRTLGFTAISLQMMDKNIFVKNTEKPLSKFVKEILSDASLLTDQYKNDEHKLKRLVIKL